MFLGFKIHKVWRRSIWYNVFESISQYTRVCVGATTLYLRDLIHLALSNRFFYTFSTSVVHVVKPMTREKRRESRKSVKMCWTLVVFFGKRFIDMNLRLMLKGICSTFSNKGKARNTLHNSSSILSYSKRVPGIWTWLSSLWLSVSVHISQSINKTCLRAAHLPTLLPDSEHRAFHFTGVFLFCKGCVSRHLSHWHCISVVDTWKAAESSIGLIELQLLSTRRADCKERSCCAIRCVWDLCCVFLEHTGHRLHTWACWHLTAVWGNRSAVHTFYIHCRWPKILFQISDCANNVCRSCCICLNKAAAADGYRLSVLPSVLVSKSHSTPFVRGYASLGYCYDWNLRPKQCQEKRIHEKQNTWHSQAVSILA